MDKNQKSRIIKGTKTEDETFVSILDAYMEQVAKKLEPLTHCCECTKHEPHSVHIQYPICTCSEKMYILKKNT
jgi:hypothetical protein